MAGALSGPAPSLHALREAGYHTVAVAAPDVHGRLFGRRIPVERFAGSVPEVSACAVALAWDIRQEPVPGISFAGPHTGWNDLVLRPDPSTLRPYPGVPGTAIVLADVVDAQGAPLPVAPRTVLRRQLERAAALGYTVRLASEVEFYLFEGDVRTHRREGFRDLRPSASVRSDYSVVGQAVQEPFLAILRRELEGAGIPVHACQAEYGLGQWEVNLEPAEALEMADRHVVYKAAVKELALARGLSATFMAMPRAQDMGSSCHLHVSVWRGEEPVFPDRDDPGRLSEVGRAFLGGLLAHLDETAVLMAPYANSYQRHRTEHFGGSVRAWGMDNRTVALRVVGRGPALRVEHRFPGADTNPYLAAAAVVAAGLDGMARGLDPGPPVTGDGYATAGLPRTPGSLGEALAAFEASTFAREAFGEEVVRHYAAHARAEWEGYLGAVTDWELDRAFELA
jgi:glutamine synthetase